MDPSLSNPGGPIPPTICGYNTGQHMFVPASPQCNQINIDIDTGTTTTTRKWQIKVTQYECGNMMAPEQDCLQYHTAASGGQQRQIVFSLVRHFIRDNRQLQLGHELNHGVCQSVPSDQPVLRHLHQEGEELLLRLLLPSDQCREPLHPSRLLRSECWQCRPRSDKRHRRLLRRSDHPKPHCGKHRGTWRLPRHCLPPINRHHHRCSRFSYKQNLRLVI